MELVYLFDHETMEVNAWTNLADYIIIIGATINLLVIYDGTYLVY